MLNKEKFAKEIASIHCDGKILAVERKTNKITNCSSLYCGQCLFCGDCCKNRREWANSEYIESILDDKEKQYLSTIIRPFKEHIFYVVKFKYPYTNREYIQIDLGDNFMIFPWFNEGKMYKGMKIGKRYKLEELGL